MKGRRGDYIFELLEGEERNGERYVTSQIVGVIAAAIGRRRGGGGYGGAIYGYLDVDAMSNGARTSIAITQECKNCRNPVTAETS